MTTQKTLLTAEDLFNMPDADDGRRYELLDGVLIEMSPPGAVHNDAMGTITYFLKAHVVPRDLGKVLPGDTGVIFRRNPDRVRAPDVCFITRDRVPPGGLPTGYLEIVPDLVVEIVSPWDRPREVREKAEEWLAAGARLVWVVAPAARTVAVYRPGAPVRTLTAAETLDAEPVLPGFSVLVADLFA